MAKNKTVYFCRNCGTESSKWVGHCPSCGEWNTYTEEIISVRKPDSGLPAFSQTEPPRSLNEIVERPEQRFITPDNEFNRVTGGGIVPGSMVLLGGEPGIGKSTLALQMALNLTQRRILYISGEESLQQIKMRAERVVGSGSPCKFANSTSLEQIFTFMEKDRPEIVVIDSIQTISTDALDASAGSISQIRECTARLLRYAKTTHTAFLLIGHITKDGILAGPKILEHMVDTVLLFEGDPHHLYRILRSLKNRFGSTSEMGIYAMGQKGLHGVENPSELLVSPNEEHLSGISIAATIDGIRPFLIEVQALVSSAVYGTPQRSCTGFDVRRLNMLLAVLEKRAGFRLGSKDVFLNIAGGLKVEDPAIDLSVVAAVLSSSLDIAVPRGCCFAAEVGLSGEIRPVSRIEQRIQEAKKLGLNKLFVAKMNHSKLEREHPDITLIPLGKIEHLVKALFAKNMEH